MEDLGYYNGRIGRLQDMSVPFLDRGHFFGDGVYEVTLARNYIIYALREHIDRLYRSAAAIDINIPLSKDELAQLLSKLVKMLDYPDQLVYFQVTRGTGVRGHAYSDDMRGNLWVSLTHGQPKDIHKKINAITAHDTRWHHCNIKSLNLIPNVMYAQNAKNAEAYETILHRDGMVTECSHSNVHIINQRGHFQTHPTDELILDGIARRHLIRACHELGINVVEEPFTLDEMMSAKEILTSSSTAFCYICDQINGQAVGGKATDIAELLRDTVIKYFIDATGGT